MLGGAERAQDSTSCTREGGTSDHSEVGNAQSVVLLIEPTHLKTCDRFVYGSERRCRTGNLSAKTGGGLFMLQSVWSRLHKRRSLLPARVLFDADLDRARRQPGGGPRPLVQQ